MNWITFFLITDYHVSRFNNSMNLFYAWKQSVKDFHLISLVWPRVSVGYGITQREQYIYLNWIKKPTRHSLESGWGCFCGCCHFSREKFHFQAIQIPIDVLVLVIVIWTLNSRINQIILLLIGTEWWIGISISMLILRLIFIIWWINNSMNLYRFSFDTAINDSIAQQINHIQKHKNKNPFNQLI